ncbi:MAG: hexose kinase [Clostridia bacterium]|nr:hexose kinase [Clostridia bacterium]
MILTICPNPSIDCTIELESLNVGMLNRIQGKVETYSGKALNVAIGVSRLSEDCTATGFMFANQRRTFEHALKKDGVKCDFVECEGDTRVNYKIIDKKSMLTEINDVGAEVGAEKQAELIDKARGLAFDADIAVMSGSLPKGVPAEFYGKVLAALPDRVKVVVDTEKNNMLSALNARELFMVKPNVKELENFSGIKIRKLTDVLVAAAKYFDKGVKYVLASLGTEGAVLTDGKDSFYCKSASVAVNSTVGAGDSMVAAACVGVYNGVPMREILKEAVAAGTAAVTTSGTNLFFPDKYREIYSKLQTERI